MLEKCRYNIDNKYDLSTFHSYYIKFTRYFAMLDFKNFFILGVYKSINMWYSIIIVSKYEIMPEV